MCLRSVPSVSIIQLSSEDISSPVDSEISTSVYFFEYTLFIRGRPFRVRSWIIYFYASLMNWTADSG